MKEINQGIFSWERNMPFRMAEEESVAVIKVIGVGGGGGNAINTMVESRLAGVQFIAANTDMQALEKSRADIRLQLGPGITKGMGAGAEPDMGKEAAQESYEDLQSVLKGADMVFVTAGLGGGTGTGAAPVIAKLSKESGALTVAVVTKPFYFEAKKRMRNAVGKTQRVFRYHHHRAQRPVAQPDEQKLHLGGYDEDG